MNSKLRASMQRIFVLGLVAAALTFGAVLASATPPAGIAGGPILARGTAAETFVIGTPQTVTVTKTVKIRVRGKVYTRRVKVQVDIVQRLMSCGAQSACDTAVQQVTINPGGHTGWHNHASAPLVLYAFYVLPTGTPNTAIRTDQPAPANCPGIP